MRSENSKGIGTKKWYQHIHVQFLSDDPTASARLVEGAFESLILQLSKKFPDLRGSDLLNDAVTDALMEYIKAPSNFDPSKRGLFGYLLMAAKRDLLNALSKKERRENREVSIDTVENNDFGGNIVSTQASLDCLIDANTTQKEIDKLFDNSEDKRMAWCILQGERSTEAYVDILGIHSLPVAEQQRVVKRNKDRIKKRIERFKEKLRGRDNQ